MITDLEIDESWEFYRRVIRRWNAVSAYGVLTVSLILCFIAKHVFGDKSKYYFLNDTVDGDFGAEWWLKRENLKPGIISAIRWWFRNHSWNYISKYNPEWKNGEVDIVNGKKEIRIIKCTVDVSRFEHGIFHWLTREDGPGIIYVAYRINGIVYFRYSEVKKNWLGRMVQRQRGAGGRRFKYNKKPILF